MIFCLDPWLQLMVCWNCSRWSVRFLSSREFFWAFCQIKGLYSTVCFFCKVSRLALRTQVPHRISILTVILISFRMRKLRPKCLNGSYLVSMTDQIYSPGPLISFLKAASPLSSCCCLVTKSCPTLCDPMDSSTPGFPVHHQLPELAQSHVRLVSDAIQPSHSVIPVSSLLQTFQHQGLFQWVSSSHQVAKVLEFQLQHQSFQWIFRTANCKWSNKRWQEWTSTF